MPEKLRATIDISAETGEELRKKIRRVKGHITRRDRLARQMSKIIHFLLSLFGYALWWPGGQPYRVYLNGHDVTKDAIGVIAKLNEVEAFGFVEIIQKDEKGTFRTSGDALLTRWRIGKVKVEAIDE